MQRVPPPRMQTPHSPRPERPPSIRGPFFLAEEEQQQEQQETRQRPVSHIGHVQIDLDSNDPFANRYRATTPSSQASSRYDQPVPAYDGLPPQQPHYNGYNAALYDNQALEDAQDQAYVEQYLVNTAYTPVPRPLSSATNAHNSRYAYQPVTYAADWEYNEKKEYAETVSGSSHSGRSEQSKDDDHANPHFGPAPLGPQLRRKRTTKRVALTHGNLVLDCPVPSRLNSFLPRKDAEEFRFMRYSAVTADVSEFLEFSFRFPVQHWRIAI